MTDADRIIIHVLGKELILHRSTYSTFEDGCVRLSVSDTESARKYWLRADGPWYDDSNPEGYGATLDEAVKDFSKEVIKIKLWVGQFETNGT